MVMRSTLNYWSFPASLRAWVSSASLGPWQFVHFTVGEVSHVDPQIRFNGCVLWDVRKECGQRNCDMIGSWFLWNQLPGILCLKSTTRYFVTHVHLVSVSEWKRVRHSQALVLTVWVMSPEWLYYIQYLIFIVMGKWCPSNIFFDKPQKKQLYYCTISY